MSAEGSRGGGPSAEWLGRRNLLCSYVESLDRTTATAQVALPSGATVDAHLGLFVSDAHSEYSRQVVEEGCAGALEVVTYRVHEATMAADAMYMKLLFQGGKRMSSVIHNDTAYYLNLHNLGEPLHAEDLYGAYGVLRDTNFRQGRLLKLLWQRMRSQSFAEELADTRMISDAFLLS